MAASRAGEKVIPGQPRTLSLNAASRESETAAERDGEGKKAAYPWVPMVLLMTVTVGQRWFCLRRAKGLIVFLFPRDEFVFHGG